jgi:hypothetical protein
VNIMSTDIMERFFKDMLCLPWWEFPRHIQRRTLATHMQSAERWCI